MIAHIKWAKGHCCTVTRYVWPEDLTARSTVVLELNGLICNVSCSCCHRVASIVGFSFFSICWNSYCEKTDKDVVVAVVSIVLSISVTSNTWLAALVTISSEKSLPAVVMLNIESESAIPPDEVEV